MTTLAPNRRMLMIGAASCALLPAAGTLAATPEMKTKRARPLPLAATRLRPSDYATAVERNRAYLHRLQPAGVDFQEGDIGFAVGANDLCFELPLVVQLNGDLVGRLDHVRIR